MDAQHTQFLDWDLSEDIETTTAPGERTFWSMILGTPKTGNALLDRARQTALLDKYKASLTHSAIQHVAAFSVMENQLYGISRRGAARVSALIDAYTIQAMKTIGSSWEDHDDLHYDCRPYSHY